LTSLKFVDNELIPKHEILDKKDVKKLLEDYTINLSNLPKIKVSDPMAKKIGASLGDVIKITRNEIGIEYNYYRVVVNK